MRYSLGTVILSAVFSSFSFAQNGKDQKVEVAFDFSHNQIIIQVKIDGKGPFNMLLDTGTDPSAIDLATAKEIGLKLGSNGHQGSGGGTATNLSYATKLPTLEVGGLAAKNVEAAAIDLSKVSTGIGRPVHGVLGHSFLKNRIVQIDYPRHEVRFYEKSPLLKTNDQAGNTKQSTLSFHYDDGVLIDGVFVDGKPMTANFDTGSSGYFKLTPAAALRPSARASSTCGALPWSLRS